MDSATSKCTSGTTPLDVNLKKTCEMITLMNFFISTLWTTSLSEASSSLRLTPAHFVGYVGASPTFLCNYTSSVGNMSSDVNITWLINDRPIDKASVQTSRFVLQDTVVGLVIEEIPASWNNSYIWCRADTHEGGSINSSLTSIELQALGSLNLTPIQFVGYVGARPTFYCDYTGHVLSGINISWLINNTPIENYAEQAIKLVLNSTPRRYTEVLLLENIPASWNNSYIWCRADIHEGSSIKSNLSTFKLQALGILNLTPIQFVGYVGATITFLCDYIGQILSGINISWLINDSPIENSAVQATKLVVNSTLGRFIEGLVIEKIPASWNNSYIWCRAHTPEGGSIKSNLSNVKLQDPGSLNLTPSHFVGYVGLNPTFRCIYTGDLLSTITISWLVNDIPIERYALQAIKFALQDTVGGLVIQNIPASWNNSYILCSAHAHEGLSVNSSLSSIKLQGLLEQVTEFRLSFEPEEFFISWNPPFSLMKHNNQISYCVSAVSRELQKIISRCDIKNSYYNISRQYYKDLHSIMVIPVNPLGNGKSNRLIIQAQLRSFGFGSLVYEGDLAKFECKQHNIYMLHIDWLLNNVSRRDTNYKTVDELEYEKNRGFLVVYTSSEIDTLKVQCKVIQRMNYYYISDPVYLRVQGALKQVKNLTLVFADQSKITISWNPPDAVITPRKGHRYCLNFTNEQLTEKLAVCDLRDTRFVVATLYEFNYEVSVGAVNKFGLGKISSILIREPKLLNWCKMKTINGHSSIEVLCSFNFSFIGYLVLLEYIDGGIYNDKYKLATVTKHSTPVVLEAVKDGEHQVMVFPLMIASNLVGRRASFVERIHLTPPTSFFDAFNYEADLADITPELDSNNRPDFPVYTQYIVIGLSGFLVGLLSGVLFGLLVMACTYKWYKKKN